MCEQERAQRARVLVYVYIYIYAYICICIYIKAVYIYSYIYIYIYIYIFVVLYIIIYIYIYKDHPHLHLHLHIAKYRLQKRYRFERHGLRNQAFYFVAICICGLEATLEGQLLIRRCCYPAGFHCACRERPCRGRYSLILESCSQGRIRNFGIWGNQRGPGWPAQ